MLPLLAAGIGGLFSNIVDFFSSNGIYIYLYYGIFLLASLLLTLSISVVVARKEFSFISRKDYAMLLLVLVLFTAFELIAVKPTFQLYNDEYIYGSIAKSIVYDHAAGICSFSSPLHCVPNTFGLFHEPVGWPILEAAAFAMFGVSFSVMFNLSFLIALASIVLVFLIASLIFEDKRIALLSSILFAFTPLFMTYARATLPDPVLDMFILLSVFLAMIYMRSKRTVVGLATIFAAGYAMMAKVDGIIVIPILLVVLLLDRHNFKGAHAKRDLVKFSALLIVGFALLTPDFIFVVIANEHSFGAAQNQAKMSIDNFVSNVGQNTLFYFGVYDKVYENGYYYYDEFPITYTALALFGAALGLKRKKYREITMLFLWFGIVFAFYAAYYGGGVLYSTGDDVRYLASSFPVVAMLAAYGIVGIGDLSTAPKTSKVRMGRRRKLAHAKKTLMSSIFTVIILVAVASELAYLIYSFVLVKPSNMYSFAAYRADKQFILAHYNEIPNNCYVLTFKPPLWYLLNKSNIYITWANQSYYYNTLMNDSKGCWYFDESTDCFMNYTQYIYGNNEMQCSYFMHHLKLQPIAIEPYNKLGWNVTFGLYKVIGFNNFSITNS
ncbi:MAG: ArnT family glycosyltransferase [Candidatus Micrarchaeia archaeon]